MKKLYFLAVMIFAANLGFGQGNEGFNNSNATSGYTDNTFVGENSISWSFIASRDENGDANSSGIDGKALMLRRSSDGSKIVSSSISGGIGNFSVKVYKGFTGGGNRQIELFVNDVSKGKSTAFDDFDEHTFVVDNINVAGDVVIRIDNSTAKQVIIDDITWTAYEGASAPTLSISSPSDNATIYTMPGEEAEVNLEFALGNFDLTTDGRIIIKDFDGNGIYVPTQSSPIALQDYVNIGVGAHSVTLALQNTVNEYLDPVVEATINFTVAEVEDVADIATFRTKTPGDGKIYRLTGEALVLHQYATTSYKKLWVRDNTGAILVYMSGDGTNDDEEEIGYIYQNAVGTISLHNGLLQFVPSDLAEPDRVSIGNDVTAIDVSLADINAGTYESNLVKLTDVNINDIEGGDGTFQSGKNYTVTASASAKDEESVVLRTGFYDADYIGNALPTTTVDLVSIVGNYNGTHQITPRDAADIIDNSLSNDLFKKASVSLYPVPTNNTLTFESSMSEIGTFEVFSTSGQLLINAQGNLSNKVLDVSKLGNGNYILKVTNSTNSHSYKDIEMTFLD